jgi:hypothetical protein
MIMHAITVKTSDANNRYQISAVNRGKDSSGRYMASLAERQWPLGGGPMKETSLTLTDVQFDPGQNRLSGNFTAYMQTGVLEVTFAPKGDPKPWARLVVSHLWIGNKDETHDIDAATLDQLAQFAAGF